MNTFVVCRISYLARQKNPSTNRGLMSNRSMSFSQEERKQNVKLLKEWASHTDRDFHKFSEEEAHAIREKLLMWYRQHRRKLPWRGDPSPWQGSTAKDTRTVKPGKQNLKNYFAVKKEKSSTKVRAESKSNKVFPITGYGVWVSEIMLQQTRVEAVIPFWTRWMQRFPTVHDLAAADEETVNAHWAGLGFYRRARLLHQASKVVVEEYSGELPQTVEGLLKLPGIGRYTASAIASVAFDVTVPVVDGNVCRVLSRLTGICNHIKAPALKDTHGWDLATQIVEAGDGSCPGLVNQALMELGATYCAPHGTGTDPKDPLKDYYMSTKLGRATLAAHEADIVREITDGVVRCNETPKKTACSLCAEHGVEETWAALVSSLEGSKSENPGDPISAASSIGHSVLPMPPPKAAKREEVLIVAVLSVKLISSRAYLLIKRPNEGLLAGQWEFPSVCVWNSDDFKGKGKRKDMSNQIPSIPSNRRREAMNIFLDEFLEGCDLQLGGAERLQLSKSLEHVFSHIRHTMWIETAELETREKEVFLPEFTIGDRQVRLMTKEQMKQVGVTSGVNKILKACDQRTELPSQVVASKRRKNAS